MVSCTSRTTRVPEKREDITLEWLNGIFKEFGILVHRFTFCGDASHCRGFMGSLEKVELEISRPGNNSSVDHDHLEDTVEGCSSIEKLHIILKTLPDDPFRKQYAANDGFSAREVSMYTEILKVWDKFLDNRQVPLANRFQYPKCYYGADEGEADTYKYILVLENLTKRKVPPSLSNSEDSYFQLWAPGFSEPLPWLAASAIVRQIARFHATGIAYKIENQVDSYYYRFPKLNHVVSSSFHMMWNSAFKIAREVIESTVEPNQIPEGLFQRLEELKGEEGQALLLKWFTEPGMVMGERNTICHHDLHSNNLVLSADKTEAILFDYQAACVMNPMKDLSFFLVLNCDFEDSTTNLSRTFQVYHDEFEKTMKAINVEFTYSLERLTKDYDMFLPFSLTHIMTGGQVWLTGDGLTEKRKRSFAMNVIDAYNRGVLKFPLYNQDQ